MTADSPEVQMRWMIRLDLPAVLAIESQSTIDTWDEDALVTHLRMRNCVCMVAEFKETVIGFMLYKLEPKHLLLEKFTVCQEWRRMGVGTRMIDKLKGKVQQQRREYIRWLIPDESLAGQMFAGRNEFKARRVIPEYFESGDAAVEFIWSVRHGEPVSKWRPENRIAKYFK